MIDARTLLSELGELSDGSRTAALAGSSGMPLVAWGIAWAIAYCALGWLDGPTGVLVAAVCLTGAGLLSWLPRRDGVRNGWESRMRIGWGVVFLLLARAGLGGRAR